VTRWAATQSGRRSSDKSCVRSSVLSGRFGLVRSLPLAALIARTPIRLRRTILIV
jgi:hypothetical protein